MPTVENKEIVEYLREFILETPDFPVKSSEFAIDGVLTENQSMCIQLNPSKIIDHFIDGTKIIQLPFDILYYYKNTTKNKDKAKMIGFLNSIGEYMDRSEQISLGDKYAVQNLEQIGLANIIERDNNDIGYAATFVLTYETLSV
jgi:hypothetical protein